jgi:hypothetical protein
VLTTPGCSVLAVTCVTVLSHAREEQLGEQERGEVVDREGSLEAVDHELRVFQ